MASLLSSKEPGSITVIPAGPEKPNPTMETPIEEPHSRIGVASFVTSIVVGVLMFALFAVAGVLHASHRDPDKAFTVLVGLGAISLFFADIVAIGLGIASIFAKNRRNIFGILGLTFSVLIFLFTIGLCVLGLKMSGKF